MLEEKSSPQIGFEPTTNRLTADRSTTELLRNNEGMKFLYIFEMKQPITSAPTIEKFNAKVYSKHLHLLMPILGLYYKPNRL